MNENYRVGNNMLELIQISSLENIMPKRKQDFIIGHSISIFHEKAMD